MQERILGYWTNFAKTGSPNGDGLPTWAHFDGKQQSVLRLGTGAEIAERGGFANFPALEATLKGP
jgi:para-nitrobenzyl esterase